MERATSEKLLGICPFCGKQVFMDVIKMETGYTMYQPLCTFCAMRGPKFYNEYKAFHVWRDFMQELVGKLSRFPYVSNIEFEGDVRRWAQ